VHRIFLCFISGVTLLPQSQRRNLEGKERADKKGRTDQEFRTTKTKTAGTTIGPSDQLEETVWQEALA
jgi:hypothetical protein